MILSSSRMVITPANKFIDIGKKNTSYVPNIDIYFMFYIKKFVYQHFIKITLLVFSILANEKTSIAQGINTDSLLATLKNVDDDNSKLKIYSKLAELSIKNNKLKYVEEAWRLVDKLMLKTTIEKERQELIDLESSLAGSFGVYYRNNDSNIWNVGIKKLDDRLSEIIKTGNKKRASTFLYAMAGIAIDEKKDSTLYRTYITQSIILAKEISDADLIIKGYRFMVSFYTSAGNYNEAMNAAQACITYCKKLNDEKCQCQSHNLIASLYKNFGEDDLALKNYNLALRLANQQNDTITLSQILQGLGGYYSQKKNISKALEYYNQLLEISKKSKHSVYSTADVLSQIAYAYNVNNDYKKAIKLYYESLEKHKSEKNAAESSLILAELGTVYSYQGDFVKAKLYHTQSMYILDSLNDPYQFKSYLSHLLAKDYYGLKKFEKAKVLNEKALIDFKRDWFDLEIRKNMELLSMQIDSARGDGFSAFAHYKEYATLAERLKGDEIKKAAQKDKFNAEIERQKLEQEKKDAIAQRTRNLQYLAILAFLLLGVFLLYAYLQKTKANKKIEKAYSDLKATQSQLIQSEKMASLGELTAGIAHEIQNPLNFVNNFSDVSKEMMSELKIKNEELKIDDEVVNELIDDISNNLSKISQHGKRASDIVKGMLEHSRKSTGEKTLNDINAMCDEYLRLAYHGYRAKDKSFNANFELIADENIPKINVIQQDMGRVLLNIINNAFYACAKKTELNRAAENKGSTLNETHYQPKVTVTTKSKDNKVEITVQDNGNGIPQNIVDKIFQPFFTTKPTGQGTGLGLSLSYDIVKAHGGELNVESTEGKETTFKILIPIS